MSNYHEYYTKPAEQQLKQKLDVLKRILEMENPESHIAFLDIIRNVEYLYLSVAAYRQAEKAM